MTEDVRKNFGNATAEYMIAGANLHKAWTELKPLLSQVSVPGLAEAIAKMDAEAEKESKASVNLFVAVLQNASAAKRDVVPTEPPADPYSGR